MAMRIAWHSAGTYDASDGSGGTNGGTMRFEPEKTDGANAGRRPAQLSVVLGATRVAWRGLETGDTGMRGHGTMPPHCVGLTVRPALLSLHPPPGLHIIHDLLLPIKKKYPDVSFGDLWALAGAAAVEFAGGPEIPLELG